ncbi:Chromosome partition protein Smc [bacterium HR15]|nr:Chromosome partition protein Smc [bacterium HR15]
MSIEIHTVEDLVRVLKEHPEWRERVLEALLGAEFLQIPSRLDRIESVLERLVESHERLWQSHQQLLESHQQLWQSHQQALARLDRLETVVQQLVESHQQLQASHQQLWESHRQLQAVVQQLVESHQQLWESHRQLQAVVQQLVEGYQHLLQEHQLLVSEMRELRQTVEKMADWVQRIDTDVGKLKGRVLELDYLHRAPARFGYYVRRPKVVNLGDFLDDLREQGPEFSQEEWTQLAMLDVLLQAQHPYTRETIYLAVEVSWMIFPHDVERARQRAELLRARGVNAYPAVAGEGFVPEAHDLAVQHKVLMLTDGLMLSETNPFRSPT